MPIITNSDGNNYLHSQIKSQKGLTKVLVSRRDPSRYLLLDQHSQRTGVSPPTGASEVLIWKAMTTLIGSFGMDSTHSTWCKQKGGLVPGNGLLPSCLQLSSTRPSLVALSSGLASLVCINLSRQSHPFVHHHITILQHHLLALLQHCCQAGPNASPFPG